jgi:hypothetical protein
MSENRKMPSPPKAIEPYICFSCGKMARYRLEGHERCGEESEKQ